MNGNNSSTTIYIPNGFFLLSRLIFESTIWTESPHILKLFIYLIGNARHDKTPKQYPDFQICRGELVTSLQLIAEENQYINDRGKIEQWSKTKVFRMLKKLKEQKYIETICDTHGTHIKITNYDTYQTIKNYLLDANENGHKKCDVVCNGNSTPPNEIITNIYENEKDSRCNESETRVKLNNKERININTKNTAQSPQNGAAHGGLPQTADTPSTIDSTFGLFWKEYPRKIDRKKALSKWTKLNPSPEQFNQIMAALKNQKQLKQWLKDNGAYIPHPTTWLNGERWNDEINPEDIQTHALSPQDLQWFKEKGYKVFTREQEVPQEDLPRFKTVLEAITNKAR